MGEKINEENFMSWSKDIWQVWISKRLGKRKSAFSAEPKIRIAEFNREREIEQDYRGRELLELIQNADDAGEGYQKEDGTNKLFIKVSRNSLYIANTGIPFSPEGIESLMLCNTSSKRSNKKTRYIGYKGLGFRSILGWASTIIIKSGNLSVAFNEKYAQKWLDNIVKEDPSINKGIHKDDWNKIATLNIPRWIDLTNNDNSEFKNIWDEIKKIQREKYDTVICIILKNAESVRKQLEKEIRSIDTKLLLFLQHINELRLISEKKKKHWKVKRKIGEIITQDEKNRENKWMIFSDEGKVPEKYRKNKASDGSDIYEIKIALPNRDVKPGNLFVYFPTEESFPFPLYVHATFDISHDRKHIRENELNTFIAKKLAELMAKSAEQIKTHKDPWRAITLITPNPHWDDCLEELKFMEKLYHAIKKYRLIPVRNNKFKKPENTLLLKGNFDSLLRDNIFNDIALYNNNENVIDFLKYKLKIEEIAPKDLCKRINSVVKNISIKNKVDILSIMIKENIDQEFSNLDIKPELFIDEKKRVIRTKTILFPTPEINLEFPDWVPQKIINSKQADLIKETLGIEDYDFIIDNLSNFNVKKPNTETLIASIIEAADRKVKRTPKKELELRQQMLQAIWSLYIKGDSISALADEIEVVLPTRLRTFKPARELYLGNEYVNGKLLDYLYSHIDNELFVASPEQLGLDKDNKKIDEFLCWLGVDNRPAFIDQESTFTKGDYLEKVLSEITWPAMFGDQEVKEAIDVECSYSKKVTVYKQFHHMEEILQKADPHAIICWVAKESKFVQWEEQDDLANISFIPSHCRNDRELRGQKIYPYHIWLLKNTAWLPSQDGKKRKPNYCLLSKDEFLFPRIGAPQLDINHPLFKKFKLDQESIDKALITAGVSKDLNTLPWDIFYEILLELPKVDKNGKNAKKIYRRLISQKNEKNNPSGKKYEKFIKNGKMYGKTKKETGYFPINKLFYSDSTVNLNFISLFYPILDLDSKKGVAKVKNIFGVNNISEKKIKKRIKDYRESPYAENFQIEFKKNAPYLYALLIDVDSNKEYLNIFKNIKFKICTEIKASISIGNNTEKCTRIEDYIIINGSTVYMIIERIEGTTILRNSLVALQIQDILFELIKNDMCNHISTILMSHDKDKIEVLDKITGGSGQDNLSKSKQLLQLQEEKQNGYIWYQYNIQNEEENEEEYPIPNKNKTDSKIFDPNINNINNAQIEYIQVSRMNPHLSVPRNVKITKIQHNPNIKALSTKPKIDANRSEKIAFKFEESQGRYPLNVSHLREAASYGCDIISFKSYEDRKIFEEKCDSFNSIIRFIEVKGRSDRQSSIVLKGYQLKTAEIYKDKFYLYRIYEDRKNNVFELIELNDPLSSPEKGVLNYQYEIKPYYSKRIRGWNIAQDPENI